MISNRKELDFYLKTDRMMNTGSFALNLKERIIDIVIPNYIMRYLKSMRYLDFYSTADKKLLATYYRFKYRKYGLKLGFSISYKVFGFGLVIPHYGTIVVGEGNNIGNYAVLHTSTCITAGKKSIGSGFYLSTGSKVINDVNISDNVNVSANSLVNKSINESNVVIAGAPAIVKKNSEPWYIRDGKEYERRYNECEKLRVEKNI